jgi:hypothetical protein
MPGIVDMTLVAVWRLMVWPAAEALSPENLDRAATAVCVATLARSDLLRPVARQT